VRIPDGYVASHANQSRIRQFPLADGKTSITSKDLKKIFMPDVSVVYAHDVIEVARAYQYFTGKDSEFSFCDAYAPVDFHAARFCDARVWSFFKSVNDSMQQYLDYAMGHNLQNRMPLYIQPNRKLSALDVAAAMRDHYENTPMDMRSDIGAGAHACPYRWRPMTWTVDSVEYLHERAAATQQTGFWFVAEARGEMPAGQGGVLWFGVDDAATSCLTPIYCGATEVPECFSEKNGDMLNYSSTSAFWLFNRVTNFAYLRYDAISKDIIKVQRELEQQALATLQQNDITLNVLRKQGLATDKLLTQFSLTAAQRTMQRWQQLDAYLLVKFIDGNIKRETDKDFERTSTQGCPAPLQPDLPEEWRRAIVKDNGEKLRTR
jgi:dipeptidase